VKRKIPILHVRDSSGIFGAERVILTLGNNIDRDRFDFKLLCMRRPDRRSERLIQFARDLGIEVYTVDIKGRIDFGAVGRIHNILKKNSIRIIHSHDFKSDFYSLVSSAGLNIRKVATAHGSTRDSIRKQLYLFWDEKVFYRMFHRVVAVSENLRYFLSCRGVRHDKVIVIQNGLDLKLLCRQSDNSEPPLYIPSGRRIFAVVGRLYPDKGHRFFLEALSMVAKNYPDVYGLIVGDGPVAETIRRNIHEFKLEGLIQMCGVRSDMQAIYGIIDCLVIPSLTEGLPYVLLEAMANHVPVLATAVGDIPQLIEDRNTGHLVPPADPEALAERMKELLSQPDITTKIVECAYHRVLKKFTAEQMVRRTEDMYLELVD
jgi:glycosyltransferase involved in cell wall biosynthesis